MSQESRITTFYDMVEYLMHYAGMDAQKQTIEDCNRATVNGLREFCSTHSWSFLNARGRLNTVAPYSTGTIAYTDATRVVTLSGGTWPTWAAFGTLRLNNVPYEVASRDAATLITLSARTAVGADLAAGTTYSLYRDTYPFPVDFRACHDLIEIGTGLPCEYLSNAAWLDIGRSWRVSAGRPLWFSVASDPNYLGSMAVRFVPSPDAVYAFDFIYQRLPRYIVVTDSSTGTITVSASSDQVTGVGTAWSSKLIGSIIRFGAAGQTLPPTSLTGSYPYTYERTVIAVGSATTLTVDEVLPEDLAVKYRISDPIDVDEGACMTAFHRECEKQLRLIRRMKPLFDGDNSESKEYDKAYIRARESDKRGIGPTVAGGEMYRRRVSEMRFPT